MAEFSYTPLQLEALRLLGGPARNIMLFGGSRSGKTFVLCSAVIVRALKAPGSRHAIIRRHFNGVKSAIGRDTMPKLFSTRFEGKIKYDYNRTDSVFTFPNQSEIWLIGLDDSQRAEKILGKEFCTIYFNECSELDYMSIQTALTRLAQNVPSLVNKAYYDCNPPGKNHWSYRVFMEKLNPVDRAPLIFPDDYNSLCINPRDNIANLPPGYLDNTLAGLSKRQRERFLEGKWLDELSGALWKPEMIDRFRIVRPPEELLRIVIGVDPAVSCNEHSDCTGIVAAGIDRKGEYYILSDRSCRETPLVWGREVVKLYDELEADRVTAEVNNGGDLVGTMLHEIAPGLSFRPVRASRGKLARAEPVAALYEQGKVHHAGIFPELEEEMCSYLPLQSKKSPDRMDALVWAITELSTPVSHFVLV